MELSEKSRKPVWLRLALIVSEAHMPTIALIAEHQTTPKSY